MFKNYFKTALRSILRNRIYSFINIAGLSIGLACAMLILLYVKDEMSYDKFHKQANQLYRVDRRMVRDNGNIGKSGYTGFLQGPRFAAGIPEIKGFIRLERGYMDVKTQDNIQSQEVYFADSNFFSVFSFPLLTGNARSALMEPHSVVISEDMAKKLFGKADAQGKTILLKDNGQFTPYAVAAVAKNAPENSSIKFNMVLPIHVAKTDEEKNENWFNSFLNTFLVLAPKADVKLVEAKMKTVFETEAAPSIKMIREKYGIKNLGLSFYLQSLPDIHLNQDAPASDGLADASNPMFSYILSGIAVFILLIACINFINLTVARSIKRAKEIGIRKVIGGSRKQLMLQFLGESFMLCFAAFLLAIFIVQIVLPAFNQLSNKSLALAYLFDVKLVAAYITLFFLTGLLAGFYPAVVLSDYNPVQTLYSRMTLSGKNYLQKSLVVFQFALASFLIIATLTFIKQFNYLTTQKLGYDDTNLVTVGKWGISRSEARLFKERLLQDPNIVDVAFKNNGYAGNTVKVNGETQVNIINETVDVSYLSLLKIPIVQGRGFSEDFHADSAHSVLVNEAFVKEAGWKEPIGQQVDFFEGKDKYTVVGVVKDYHFKPMSEKIGPQLFNMRPDNDYGTVYIKIRPKSETAGLQHIEKTFKSLFPVDSYSYIFKEQENLKNYEAEAKWKQIILFSAVLTIFISCIGLFGLSVLSAEKRTKEIGVRKVLGASVSGVVTILSKDFLKLVFISLLIAVPLAWIAANKWLQSYPYRITLNWWMFTVAALLLVLVALVTVSFQAIKAAVANPVESLRSE